MTRILFIGDIVGSSGRHAVKKTLPYLKTKYSPHIVIANGENAAGGKGITAKIANELFELGIDGLTMGNHTWDNKEIFDFIDSTDRLIRPANYPEGTPGRGMTTIKAGGKTVTVINLQGRTFLPPLDCPFKKANDLLTELQGKSKCIFVDFHAEATSEKIAMGWHLDGKVSAVVGTHTHVQTHDEKILPGGTAYVTDVGMAGSMDGVLGMEKEAVLYKFITQLPARFTADEGKWHLHAVALDIDESDGKAKSIKLIRLREDEWIEQ